MSRPPSASGPLGPNAFAGVFEAVIAAGSQPPRAGEIRMDGASLVIARSGDEATQGRRVSPLGCFAPLAMTGSSGPRKGFQDEDVASPHPEPRSWPRPLLLAVSGGPDSTALMHAAARWSACAGGPRLVVATVDHGLRRESRREAERVAEAADRLGLAHRLLVWRDPPARASQEGARRARYDLLVGLAREIGAAAILTAHTLDDQAETLLIRMAAGSGPSGLAGMRARSRRDGVILHRPLLGFAKARLVATCRAEGWDYVDDPANADERFARVRWRRLLPALAAEGLDARRLARLAGRLRRAEDALAAVATGALEASRLADGALDLALLARQPNEIVIRAVALTLQPAAALRLDRLEGCVAALLAALREGRPIRRTLSGRLLDLDRGGRLAISAEPPRVRGRRPALTTPAVAMPHSLGIGVGHA